MLKARKESSSPLDSVLVEAMQEQTARLEEANRLLKNGQRGLAVVIFREAAEAEERIAAHLADNDEAPLLRAQSLLSAGSCWLMAGDPRAAVAALQHCIVLDPGPEVVRLAELNMRGPLAAISAFEESFGRPFGYLAADHSQVSETYLGAPGGCIRYRGQEFSTSESLDETKRMIPLAEHQSTDTSRSEESGQSAVTYNGTRSG